MRGPDYEQAFLDAIQRVKVDLSKPPPDPTIVVETLHEEPLPETGSSQEVGRVTPTNLWSHPESHPIVLDLLLLRKYGPEWTGWDPDATEMILREEFKSVSALNLQKLYACAAMHNTSTFWTNWEVFTPCTMALNGEFPDFSVMQVPTVAQCMVSADIAARIRSDVSWSDEMKKFLASVHLHDGILVPQPPLNFVEVEHDAEIDVPWIREQLIESKKKHVPEDLSDDRWNNQRNVNTAQVCRALTVTRFLEESRERLRYQLGLISNA